MIWVVVNSLVGKPPNSGIAFYLTRDEDDDDADRFEVGRVAFTRTQSAYPDVTFEDALAQMKAKADAAADALNEYAAEHERLMEVAYTEARERLQDLLGPVEGRKEMA